MNVRDIMELRDLAPSDLGINNDFLVERSAEDVPPDDGGGQNPIDWIYHVIFGLIFWIAVF